MIYLCEIHGFVAELTEYLFRKDKLDYLEIYVCKVNPQAAGDICAVLLDLGCDESRVLGILQSVRGACPVDPFIPQMEQRGRLKLILPWMEGRIEEGLTDRVLNNAVAKVYIETNKEPELFLRNNPNYDPLEIGKFCEDKDPHMAVAAYVRGECDDELLALTNKHGLFRLQANYLIHRQSPEVWAKVLGPDSDEDFRRSLVDQVAATGLPEATSAEEVLVAVSAFAAAGQPLALLQILERIVLQKCLQNSVIAQEMSSSPELQSLLLYTAMECSKPSVKELIGKLNYFDASEAGAIAISEPFKLYEEALLIYKKVSLLVYNTTT